MDWIQTWQFPPQWYVFIGMVIIDEAKSLHKVISACTILSWKGVMFWKCVEMVGIVVGMGLTYVNLARNYLIYMWSTVFILIDDPGGEINLFNYNRSHN